MMYGIFHSEAPEGVEASSPAGALTDIQQLSFELPQGVFGEVVPIAAGFEHIQPQNILTYDRETKAVVVDQKRMDEQRETLMIQELIATTAMIAGAEAANIEDIDLSDRIQKLKKHKDKLRKKIKKAREG